ncbi:MAG: hypothetical protein C3F13_09065 [Anaerolineales bacterium]|nr:DUF4332 domain-containing protein [Anaerolineae bacterium]PWB53550.1 MAG: hypothetical protein C3F13_09065 [Anaerolineales bacterium]
MAINWDEVHKALSPMKDYEDCCQRYKTAFGYGFVCQIFNYPLNDVVDYTNKLLLGDARNRYRNYHAGLTSILGRLQQASVANVLDLSVRTADRDKLENFTRDSGIPATETVAVLKYLVYWFIPNEKYLSGLVRSSSAMTEAIKQLGKMGVRTNLQTLEQGRTTDGRRALSDSSNLPANTILELVNRADLSRLPWASKATISNIIGAGYSSLAQLASADPDQLYADFFAYGKKIGKNLKLGNEIENSYRIARIVPRILEDS